MSLARPRLRLGVDSRAPSGVEALRLQKGNLRNIKISNLHPNGFRRVTRAARTQGRARNARVEVFLEAMRQAKLGPLEFVLCDIEGEFYKEGRMNYTRLEFEEMPEASYALLCDEIGNHFRLCMDKVFEIWLEHDPFSPASDETFVIRFKDRDGRHELMSAALPPFGVDTEVLKRWLELQARYNREGDAWRMRP